jgi:hypothetical protein
VLRKEGEKDLWVEIWTATLNGGLLQSTKLTSECSKIYNDTIFGGVSWAKNNSKIAFIGESPAISVYKNPWD